MLTSLLLAFAPMAPAVALPATPRPQAGRRAREIRDLQGKRIGSEDDPEAALGGNYSSGLGPRATARATLRNRVWEVTLTNTGTGWDEKFLIGVPRQPLIPAPLLVGFHGYNSNHWNVAVKTSFFRDAMRRGWIVVTPLGAHEFNYGIDYAQQNIEAVLDWVATYLMIDPERIYGVGFSMGGGGAAAYAARHLDPNHPRFAAVYDHTGTVSIEDVWTHASDTTLLENPLMFGGSPSQFPFRYQQASVIDLDASGMIDPEADLARNLVPTGVKIFAVDNDPLQHLVVQSQLLDQHLSSLGGQPQLEIVRGTVHTWNTLSEQAVLNWFHPQRFEMPPLGTQVQILADRDARWYHFETVQQTAGQFSPFRWAEDEVNNRLVLDKIDNLNSLRFDPLDTRLSAGSGAAFEIMLDLESQSNLDVVLDGYPQNPASVTRTGGQGAPYTWNPATDTVTLHETLGGNYARWTVIR